LEHENRTLPADKTQLKEYIKKGWARQYHMEVFTQNQASSKLKNWEKRNSKKDVGIAYSVSFNFWYEPLYVARQGTPTFDERYVGYGMTRNTQV